MEGDTILEEGIHWLALLRRLEAYVKERKAQRPTPLKKKGYGFLTLLIKS